MITCPTCGSTCVGHFRLDSDWGFGGDWRPGNENETFNPHPEAGYTEEDIQSFDQHERPDIDCHVCCRCFACFDPQQENNNG